MENHNQEKINKKIIAKGLGSTALFIVLVFALAGKADYWQGWVYTAISIGILLLTIAALADKPDLIKERLSPGQGMKWWDKIYFGISTPLLLLSIAIAVLDRGRFGWTRPPALGIYILFCLMFTAGHLIFLWAKRENRFFSSVVRIQADRGQQVCDSGPYRFVRHPGYAGALLFSLATPAVLGSLYMWAIIPALLFSIVLIIRTYLEDKTLRKELAGYAAYTQKTRSRLLPKIW